MLDEVKLEDILPWEYLINNNKVVFGLLNREISLCFNDDFELNLVWILVILRGLGWKRDWKKTQNNFTKMAETPTFKLVLGN